MKRKILVPVDFSPVSHNAYCYARELAKVFNCTLEVIHAYSVSYTNNRTTSLMADAGMAKTAQTKMNAFIEKYNDDDDEGTVLTEVVVNKHVERGAPVPLVVQESKDDEVFLIVMGTTGKYEFGNYILGSVGSRIAQRAYCPVLLIPEKAKYRPFRNILYASNFEAAKRKMLREIINFANLFRAAVHFVHVKGEKSTEDFQKTKEVIFDQLFKDGNPSFSFNMDVVKNDSVVDGLNDYADENNIDLVVLVNKQRGFFDSLMGKSESKNMALDLKHPLMVYHYPAYKK